MELDERKKKILQAVIKNYLETGEPVGSRTISKYTDLNLSSATIRNEMADLEELGYIFQPHTSAGRIPTDMGYRLYVDDMLSTREKELDKKDRKLDDKAESLKTMQEIMDKRVDRIEEVLKAMAKMLTNNTNYICKVYHIFNPLLDTQCLKHCVFSVLIEYDIETPDQFRRHGRQIPSAGNGQQHFLRTTVQAYL